MCLQGDVLRQGLCLQLLNAVVQLSQATHHHVQPGLHRQKFMELLKSKVDRIVTLCPHLICLT